MKTIAWDDKTTYAEIVREAEEQDVVIVRDGHAIALLTRFDDDDLEWYARERDPAFLASLARARQQVREQRTISHADLKRDLDID